MTVRLFGTRSICRISSEVMIAFPSTVRPGMLRTLEPVARMTFFVFTRCSPPAPATITLLRPSIRPWPLKRVILFFLKR